MKKINKRQSYALLKIKKLFPNVTKVIDATKTIAVTVTSNDSKTSTKKDSNNCALANACVREKVADHAIINIGTSYLIKGNVATRYKTSVGIGREITSFDRHQDFAAGKDYKLCSIPPSAKLGKLTGGHNRHKPIIKKSWPKQIHRTADIRSAKHYK